MIKVETISPDEDSMVEITGKVNDVLTELVLALYEMMRKGIRITALEAALEVAADYYMEGGNPLGLEEFEIDDSSN